MGEHVDARRVRNLADLYREQQGAVGVSRGNLAWYLHRQIEKTIDASDDGQPTGAMTPAEVVAEMMEMPALLLEAFVRSKELHGRPEVLEVVQSTHGLRMAE